MRLSVLLGVCILLVGMCHARPMGGGGPGFKGPHMPGGPRFNSTQLFGCTGDCTADNFKFHNCTGTCNVQISGFNGTQPMGFDGNHTRPNGGPALSGCTGDCTVETFPICTGTCIAFNATAHPHGDNGDFNRTRPVFQLSACTGNCTETNFPLCVGTCTVTTNMTLPISPEITRPAMPGVSGCTGGCTETTFPICSGSCVVTANMTMPLHGGHGPGGHGGGDMMQGGHHGKPGGHGRGRGL